jgi:hypothetical protein
MTIAPERTSLSPLAVELTSIFDANPTQLQRLAGLLATGQIPLSTHRLRIAPYVGPAAKQMAEIRQLAGRGVVLARQELHAITQYHEASRYTPFMQFLGQFPAEWRPMLLLNLKDPVIGIELKAGADNRVVEIVSWRNSLMFEYALRGFMLTFAQTVEIADWMRSHEDELPLNRAASMPVYKPGDKAAEGARWAALTTFFDNFPERYRNLLAKKARPQLKGVRFQELPTGEVRMVLVA